jgi:hypothetical protein
MPSGCRCPLLRDAAKSASVRSRPSSTCRGLPMDSGTHWATPVEYAAPMVFSCRTAPPKCRSIDEVTRGPRDTTVIGLLHQRWPSVPIAGWHGLSE